jgi:flagellar FliL protein
MSATMANESAPKEAPKAKPDAKAKPDPKAAPDPKARAMPGEAEPRPKRALRRRYALLGLIALAAAGGGTWQFMQDEPQPKAAAAAAKGATAGKSEKAEPAKPPQFVALEPITVNLRADGSPEHYLQVGLTYQVATSPTADAMKLHMPVIRSNILLLLSAKAPKELATLEGKAKLSEELLAAARKPLPDGADPLKGIGAVHYSSFIIQ